MVDAVSFYSRGIQLGEEEQCGWKGSREEAGGPGARRSPREPGSSKKSKDGAGLLPDGSRSSGFPGAAAEVLGQDTDPKAHNISFNKREQH